MTTTTRRLTVSACLPVVWSLLVLLGQAGLVFADDTPPPTRSPAQPARMIAEWEPAWGTLIRWPLGIPSSLVVELARDDTLYTLVETTSAENQARNTFQNWGVAMEHVVFIRSQVYSMWTRDWGPLSIFDGNGQIGITDPWFDGYPWISGCNRSDTPPPLVAATRVNESSLAAATPIGGSARVRGERGYEEDDAINATLAEFFGWPLHQIPAYCTGGNIMTDGFGAAMSTWLMYQENAPHMTENQFRDRASEYLGIETYTFVEKPEVHGIQHIDCYAKLLDPETVLIKEVPTWHPEYGCCEHLVAEFAALNTCYGRPYRIIRIYCGSYSGNAVAAYTNSLILNTKVLVPLFDIASDDDALQTYADAMPGYEIIGFDYHSWYYYDALHCRTMGIFDAGMLRVTHMPLDEVVSWAPQHEITATIDDRSEAGLIADQLRVVWQLAGDAGWQTAPLTSTVADSFVASIPGQPPASRVNYYLAAADNSGRNETLPPSAPGGYYSYLVDPATSVAPVPTGSPLAVASFPNPSPGLTAFRLTTATGGPTTVRIFDLAGRCVRTLLRAEPIASGHILIWDGNDARGATCPDGVYLLTLRQGTRRCTERFTLVR